MLVLLYSAPSLAQYCAGTYAFSGPGLVYSNSATNINFFGVDSTGSLSTLTIQSNLAGVFTTKTIALTGMKATGKWGIKNSTVPILQGYTVLSTAPKEITLNGSGASTSKIIFTKTATVGDFSFGPGGFTSLGVNGIEVKAIANGETLTFSGRTSSGSTSTGNLPMNCTGVSTAKIIPFNSLATYYVFDPLRVNLASGLASIYQWDTTDTAKVGTDASTGYFQEGSFNGVAVGNEGLQLSTIVNRNFMNSNWAPKGNTQVGYWSLESNTDDSNGFNNGFLTGSGTYTTGGSGASVLSRPVKIGLNSLQLSGAGHVNVGTLGSLGSSLGAGLSVQAWIRTSSTAAMTLVGNHSGTGAAYPSFSLQINNSLCSSTVKGTVLFALRDGSAGATKATSGCVSINTGILDNQWHHILATINPATAANPISIYVDGVPLAVNYVAGPATGMIFNSIVDPVYIGAMNSKGTAVEKFSGTIDEVGIWNASLSSKDVHFIYSSQFPASGGSFTSRLMYSDTTQWTSLGWTSSLVSGKELPDFNVSRQSETSTDYPGIYLTDLSLNQAALYHFNETAAGSTYDFKDESGSNLNGNRESKTTSTIAFNKPGKFLGSIQFNGANSQVNLGTNSLLKNTKYLSLSVWIKLTKLGVNQTIFQNDQWDASNKCGIKLSVTASNQVYLAVGNCAGVNPLRYTTSTTALVANRWYNITVALPIFKIYIDGIDQLSTVFGSTSSYGYSAVPLPSYLGPAPSSTEHLFAYMDEVSVWYRQLNIQEIESVFRRGSANVMFQVRTCTDSSCAPVSGSSTGVWKGVDNTGSTYFSEIHNNSVPLTGTGFVLKTPPSLLYSKFGSTFVIGSRKYFQYRALLTMDSANNPIYAPYVKSVTAGPSKYATSSAASIYYNSPTSYSTGFTGFKEYLGPKGCSSVIKYQLSTDKVNWYYVSTSSLTWVKTTSASYTAASSAAYVNGYITAFTKTLFPGPKNLYVRAFLKSSGTSACELKQLELVGN